MHAHARAHAVNDCKQPGEGHQQRSRTSLRNRVRSRSRNHITPPPPTPPLPTPISAVPDPARESERDWEKEGWRDEGGPRHTDGNKKKKRENYQLLVVFFLQQEMFSVILHFLNERSAARATSPGWHGYHPSVGGSVLALHILSR
ncbi:unnamed protein product [Pleuronectes platessa]|uniref:Uncharacterized protein n=1 Tax=Pleuronectes platessa TaxID=8262 RepID=A0A9N7VY03_PLEPL|nr:unnamed protein product [Pleuronectes platessa]